MIQAREKTRQSAPASRKKNKENTWCARVIPAYTIIADSAENVISSEEWKLAELKTRPLKTEILFYKEVSENMTDDNRRYNLALFILYFHV